MATDFTPTPWDDWSDFEQGLFDDMATRSGHPELLDDDDLLSFYDIAFNTPKGEMDARDRLAIMDALRGYIEREYNFRFDAFFDWREWREAMGY